MENGITAYYKSYREAAERLGVSVAQIKQMVEDGDLIASTWQRKLWITEHELSRYEKLRRDIVK